MRALAVALWLIGGSVACSQDYFIDKEACPGEGCAYGETWTARESTQLVETPGSSAAIVANVGAGESVRTVTGEVHTLPGRFEVHRAHGDFRSGDEVLVYTYLGEGWFRLRHNGEVKDADLGFSPWGGTTGTRCADQDRCWGSLKEELRFDWWVLVRTESGVEGWIRLDMGKMPDQWSYEEQAFRIRL
jgi:hypothetical protein